ncbi:TRAP transporter large permease [Xanthobacter sp. DSM 24535]|uniref:TRAP transporter large permease n=1 Tax=Roseixanthobacter psychrophilus TaxID=3119917 RepID=UPI0037266CA4
MSGVEIGLIALILLVAMLLLGLPIGPALIGVSFLGLWALKGWAVALGALGIVPFNFAANWILSSLPMFLLMGHICNRAGLTDGLFQLARVWLAAIPGGLAIASVLGATGFAAMCGSSLACSATIGKIAIPQMIAARYHPGLAAGSVAAAGTIGALIPPSIILIFYGLIAEAPVTQLFLAGISAGLLTSIGYILVILIRTRLDPSLAPPLDHRANRTERLAAFRETWPVVLLLLSVFGGLFGGVFTPTEAGAAGAATAALIGFAKRSLSLSAFVEAVGETAQTTCALILIGIGASLLARLLTIGGTGAFIADNLAVLGQHPAALMLAIALLYLVLGCFLEPISSMLITLPIVLPLVATAGLDPIWFGVVLTKLLEIGMITPPVGLNVFVIKGVVGDLAPTSAIFRGLFWFGLMDMAVLAMLICVPDVVLFLPSVLG